VSAGVAGLRDIVHVHVTADLPIRAKALPFADRLEIRLGKAFPVVLIVDGPALGQFADAIAEGRSELERARQQNDVEG